MYIQTKFRTVDQVLEILRNDDPETALSEHFLRQLIKDKKIRVIQSGNKYLIDMESLRSYLEGF